MAPEAPQADGHTRALTPCGPLAVVAKSSPWVNECYNEASLLTKKAMDVIFRFMKENPDDMTTVAESGHFCDAENFSILADHNYGTLKAIATELGILLKIRSSGKSTKLYVLQSHSALEQFRSDSMLCAGVDESLDAIKTLAPWLKMLAFCMDTTPQEVASMKKSADDLNDKWVCHRTITLQKLKGLQGGFRESFERARNIFGRTQGFVKATKNLKAPRSLGLSALAASLTCRQREKVSEQARYKHSHTTSYTHSPNSPFGRLRKGHCERTETLEAAITAKSSAKEGGDSSSAQLVKQVEEGQEVASNTSCTDQSGTGNDLSAFERQRSSFGDSETIYTESDVQSTQVSVAVNPVTSWDVTVQKERQARPVTESVGSNNDSADSAVPSPSPPRVLSDKRQMRHSKRTHPKYTPPAGTVMVDCHGGIIWPPNQFLIFKEGLRKKGLNLDHTFFDKMVAHKYNNLGVINKSSAAQAPIRVGYSAIANIILPSLVNEINADSSNITPPIEKLLRTALKNGNAHACELALAKAAARLCSVVPSKGQSAEQSLLSKLAIKALAWYAAFKTTAAMPAEAFPANDHRKLCNFYVPSATSQRQMVWYTTSHGPSLWNAVLWKLCDLITSSFINFHILDRDQVQTLKNFKFFKPQIDYRELLASFFKEYNVIQSQQVQGEGKTGTKHEDHSVNSVIPQDNFDVESSRAVWRAKGHCLIALATACKFSETKGEWKDKFEAAHNFYASEYKAFNRNLARAA
eukprot:Blabericola_migrator_1__5081@NODE_262_length_10689_cov_220_487008_g219_i0_p3_GENE_NODE_262_length_10689_cov_220_487008_g219_i0NODE_262_length_10689_cov_220_487008_g219_i0_p3_ORF_typecomplete_len818_score90_73_NODE_262_length_10689_cov_220_487008_g219_i02072456